MWVILTSLRQYFEFLSWLCYCCWSFPEGNFLSRFLHAGCPVCHPVNSAKAIKRTLWWLLVVTCIYLCLVLVGGRRGKSWWCTVTTQQEEEGEICSALISSVIHHSASAYSFNSFVMRMLLSCGFHTYIVHRKLYQIKMLALYCLNLTSQHSLHLVSFPQFHLTTLTIFVLRKLFKELPVTTHTHATV